MVVNQTTAGAAVRTIITSGMTPSVPGAGQTFTVADDTGYPSSGAFTVVIDKGESNEEKILISSRSGTTFTVSSRGYDGTSAGTHTSNVSTCQHPLASTIVNLLITHVDDGEADPHSTKLLNNARHDIEARHQFGAAYGTPVTPTALTPDIAGAAGTGNNPAREDHVHNVPAGVPVAVGTALSEGAAADFARSNHVHELGNGSIDSSNLFAAGVINDENAFGAALSPVIVSSTNPGAVGANRIWLNTAANKEGLLRRNAADTNWDCIASFGPSISYTPVLTNMIVGAGGINVARYRRFGRTILADGFIKVGTGATFGPGNLGVGLPVVAADYSATYSDEFFFHGAARASKTAVWAGVGVIGVGTVSKDLDTLTFFATGGQPGWDDLEPGNEGWAVGSRFSWFVEYEAADAVDANYV